MKYLKPCNEQGCGNLTETRYCKDHTYTQKNFRSSAKMGYDYKWRKARKQFLEMNPLCEWCGMLADTVDHVQPHKGDRQLFWNRDNWQPMCHSCHSKKTATEDMGGWSNELGNI